MAQRNRIRWSDVLAPLLVAAVAAVLYGLLEALLFLAGHIGSALARAGPGPGH